MQGPIGVQAHSYVCDVADAEAVKELKAEIGRVDILVNNAGVGVGGAFLDTTEDDWTWLRSINLDGVVHGCRTFGAAMVEQGHGQIVNIASGAGYLPKSQNGHVLRDEVCCGDVLALSASRFGTQQRWRLRRVPGRHQYADSAEHPAARQRRQ